MDGRTSPLRSLRLVIDGVEQFVTSAILVLILVIIFTNVCLRYLFGAGIPWSEELARMFFIAMSYLAISRINLKGIHFRIRLLQETFPGSQRGFEIFADLFQFLFLAYLAWITIRLNLFIHDMGHALPASGIPLFYMYMPLSIGLTLGTLRSLERFIASVWPLTRRGR